MFLITFTGYSQITNPNLINYEIYADEWRQECDNDWASNDDNMVRVAVTTDGSSGGTITWNYTGTCTSPYAYVRRWGADAPTSNVYANSVYSRVNSTSTTGFVNYTVQSWESDNGFNCLPVSGDDCRWGPFSYTATYRSAAKTPNQWWGVNGTSGSGDWSAATQGRVRLKTVWRYTKGSSCSDPLDFGTLVSGVSNTHFNSNRATPAGARAEMGYTNIYGNSAPDVYYTFSITQPSTVVISTISSNSNYDTYLRLFNSDCSTQIEFNDDFGGVIQSQITRNLCAGTYKILVEGFSSNSGNFELSVLATTIPISGGTIAGGTSPVCSGVDPGAFTSTTNGSGLGTLTYQWEVSITSSGAGFGDITSATSVTYDLPAVTQTSWYRRRVTDECGRTVYSNVIQIVVHPTSTSPTIATVPGTVCPNTNTTLTASGGVAGGGTVYWYSGANGTGTALGTGNSIVVAPTSTTTYYARRQGCNTTADATVTVNVKSYVYAANGTSTNTYCTDNNGWNHFYSGDDIIFSVQGNLSGAPAGFPVATIYDNSTYYQQTQGPATPAGCASNLNPNEERFEMDRSWNLNFGGGTQTGTYAVRFYYQPAEKTAIETAANTHIAAYLSCGYSYKYATPNGFYWFKNVGSNYVAPQYDGTHFTATTATTSSGINYSEWAGVTNFSGGSGAVILIPATGLGVEMTNFAANCLDNKILLNWQTGSEVNSSHFEIEQSINGVEWKKIGQVQASGNSSTIKNYEFSQNDPRNVLTSYFRLKQFDNDGQYKNYGPVIATCENEEMFVAFPNPTKNNVSLLIKGTFNENETYVSLIDINGRVIQSVPYLELKNNLFTLDLSMYENGIYIVRLFDGLTNSKMIKLVKQ